MPHTSAPRGKRIYVVLKNGEKFVDKFIERTAHQVIFAERTIDAADIQTFSIYRETSMAKTNPRSGKKQTIKVTIKDAKGKEVKTTAKNMQEVDRIIKGLKK